MESKQYQKLLSRQEELAKQDGNLRKEYTTLLRKCQSLFGYLENDSFSTNKLLSNPNGSSKLTGNSGREIPQHITDSVPSSDSSQATTSVEVTDKNQNLITSSPSTAASTPASALPAIDHVNSIKTKGTSHSNTPVTKKILKRKISEKSIKKLPDLKWYNDQIEYLFDQLKDNSSEFVLPEELQSSYDIYKSTPILYNDIKEEQK